MEVPVYGIDKELQASMAAKYSVDAEAQAKGWIAQTLHEAWPAEAGFMDALRNGQILCRLANAIKPGAVKSISTSRLAFKEMENISLFLRAAAELGVPQHDLFQTIDLYEAKNPVAVLDAIFALSRCTAHLHGGEVLGPKLSEKRTVVFTDEQLRDAKNVPSMQSGYTKGANASGVSFGSVRQIDANVGSGAAEPSQQSGFTGGANASGVSMGAMRQITDPNVETGTNGATTQIASGFAGGANSSGISYGQRRDILSHSPSNIQ